MIPPLGLLDSLPLSNAAGANSSQAAGAATASTGASFGSFLGNAASSVIGNLDKAEQLSIQALQGNGDTRQVVDAVMGAERSLQTAIAIRDKIVSAWLDVSRMSI